MKYFMIDNLVFGGAERQASYLFDASLGIDQIILIEDEIRYDLTIEKPIITLNDKILKIYQRPLEDTKASIELSKLFNHDDIVVSFLERSNIMNIKSSLKTQHKAIISVRNYLSERYKSPKYFYRMRQIKKYYPLADIIVANSQESKQDLIKNFGIPEEKIRVIYNVIDLENVKLLKDRQIKSEHEHIFKHPVIINIGSLTPQKAQLQLIESFALVKTLYPEYKMVIIGTGRLEEELLKTVAKLDLQNEVYFLGNVQNPFKYLNKSEIFVLNSDYEGFPNVLLEALAVGIPVVSKNCLSGPSEMLEASAYKNDSIFLTEYGYLFPKRNNKKKNLYKKEKRDLFKSITSLIAIKENEEEKFKTLKTNCKQRAKDFSKETIIKQWYDLLNSD